MAHTPLTRRRGRQAIIKVRKAAGRQTAVWGQVGSQFEFSKKELHCRTCGKPSEQVDHLRPLGGGRTSKVVGIFPTETSLVRLAGAVLRDTHEEWLAAERRFLSRRWSSSTPSAMMVRRSLASSSGLPPPDPHREHDLKSSPHGGTPSDCTHSADCRRFLAEAARIARAVVEPAGTVGYAERLRGSVDRASVTARTYHSRGNDRRQPRRGT